MRKTLTVVLTTAALLTGLAGTATADPAHQVPPGPGRDHLNSNIGCAVKRQNIGNPETDRQWGALYLCTTHGKQLATVQLGR